MAATAARAVPHEGGQRLRQRLCLFQVLCTVFKRRENKVDRVSAASQLIYIYRPQDRQLGPTSTNSKNCKLLDVSVWQSQGGTQKARKTKTHCTAKTMPSSTSGGAHGGRSLSHLPVRRDPSEPQAQPQHRGRSVLNFSGSDRGLGRDASRMSAQNENNNFLSSRVKSENLNQHPFAPDLEDQCEPKSEPGYAPARPVVTNTKRSHSQAHPSASTSSRRAAVTGSSWRQALSTCLLAAVAFVLGNVSAAHFIFLGSGSPAVTNTYFTNFDFTILGRRDTDEAETETQTSPAAESLSSHVSHVDVPSVGGSSFFSLPACARRFPEHERAVELNFESHHELNDDRGEENENPPDSPSSSLVEGVLAQLPQLPSIGVRAQRRHKRERYLNYCQRVKSACFVLVARRNKLYIRQWYPGYQSRLRATLHAIYRVYMRLLQLGGAGEAAKNGTGNGRHRSLHNRDFELVVDVSDGQIHMWPHK